MNFNQTGYKMDIADGKDIMFLVTYGSKLYGTNSAKSDTDLKAIYLPKIDDMLLGKRLVATKKRWDAAGERLPDFDSEGKALKMPDGGTECEYIPFQVFVRDYVAGQTYAVECAFAIKSTGPTAPTNLEKFEYQLVTELIRQFGNAEVYSMVGFAAKQTLDYVHRGERLNEVTAVRDIIQRVYDSFEQPLALRLDTKLESTSELILEYVASFAGLKIGAVTNTNRTLRTLELNGRSYPETTALSHVLQQLNKLIDSYGERTNRAAEVDVDYKSLSHAVRVYQQAIEILDTGSITFPRPNVSELFEIKEGRADLDDVKEKLKALDAEVLEKIQTSTIRKKTLVLQQEAEVWLVEMLRKLYEI